MSKKSSNNFDSGQNPIPGLADLGLEQKQKEEQSKLFNDDSEDSVDELEVRVEAGNIRKYRNKPEGLVQEEYDIHARCESFLNDVKFTPKKGSSAKKKSDKGGDAKVGPEVSTGEEKKLEESKSGKKAAEAMEPLVPSVPILLQYSFVAHALGLQALRSSNVNQAYKPLKESQFTERVGRRATLPRLYSFRSGSAPEFLANQRLWSRSITRENRNLLDNDEYRDGIEEIDSARPDDAIDITSRFWEFTDEKRPEITAKTLESTKFVPRIFRSGNKDFLGEEHYVQQGGSAPTNTNHVAKIIKSELAGEQERTLCRTLIKDMGYKDVDSDFLISLRELGRERNLREKELVESEAGLKSLINLRRAYQERRGGIIAEYSSKDISDILRDEGGLEDVQSNINSAYAVRIEEFKKTNGQTSTQAIRLLAVEPRRNPASFILHQMALDLINSGMANADGRPLYTAESVFSMIPMTMTDKEALKKGVAADNGASRTVTVARSVNNRLSNFMPYKFYYPGGDGASDYLQEQFMLREGVLVGHWIDCQKVKLEQELERTNKAILDTKSEEELKSLTDRKARFGKYHGLCVKLTPGPMADPVTKMSKDDMRDLVELIDLNSKAKWYARPKSGQNLGNSL